MGNSGVTYLNTSPGSVLVSLQYWFVKQCCLVNITGLYRVQVSEKYRFLPQRFNMSHSFKTLLDSEYNRFVLGTG